MDTQKKLTVFTPTYNRKHLLRNCYESLKRQTSFDFVWLIVDDGSKDGTEAEVSEWIDVGNPFEIIYIYKENGGLHTAYNIALEQIRTELCICIDSDDYVTDDAVACILNFWSAQKRDDVAGIVALNQTVDTEILGNPLPALPSAHIIDLYCKYNCRRDLKMIYRSDILKENAPIPVFPSERFMNPYYLFLKVDKQYPMLLLNKPVCIVNYQTDGMSTSIVSQYIQSPNSYAELRRMMMSMPGASWTYVYKNAIHYVSSMIFAARPHMIAHAPNKIAVSLALLPGIALNILIRLIHEIKKKKKYSTIIL